MLPASFTVYLAGIVAFYSMAMIRFSLIPEGEEGDLDHALIWSMIILWPCLALIMMLAGCILFIRKQFHSSR